MLLEYVTKTKLFNVNDPDFSEAYEAFIARHEAMGYVHARSKSIGNKFLEVVLEKET